MKPEDQAEQSNYVTPLEPPPGRFELQRLLEDARRERDDNAIMLRRSVNELNRKDEYIKDLSLNVKRLEEMNSELIRTRDEERAQSVKNLNEMNQGLFEKYRHECKVSQLLMKRINEARAALAKPLDRRRPINALPITNAIDGEDFKP